MKTLKQTLQSVRQWWQPSHSPEPSVAGKKIIIQFQNIQKTYNNGTCPLRQISLVVCKGDFLFITGASGAGKSTFLKLIYGAEKPTSGNLTVLGETMTDLKGDRLSQLRRKMGIVFQDYQLIPQKTIAENLTFVLRAQGFSPAQIQRRLPPTLKMLGLSHKANCFPHYLSGGEQQRASLARALVGTPPLLLADEPTGNLDSHNAMQVMKILQKVNRMGITILVTTHDERLIQFLGKPVLSLHQGHLTPVD
ncbi:cell division ATP-binding protein FtsE [Roseofilum reptotaenium CS-1145]|uniref:Cell division ATP-binding protein FtsE n=1 Tax=Roseofilum reptotaenium AO1-A TaxID=1925591 RepID=A0A1L9QQP0_9CYAN|nr:cell division ATP-binding protein FtsE [Roseofilum reptotaenium]MDB9516571.1 cell division ATP-binding protein FtsE [Roseofilum reptotaenium CS-1145]OJJ24907.1 cell division ATP-binding protein FtsE [Roseofilum reptotaenium AO1-A]